MSIHQHATSSTCVVEEPPTELHDLSGYISKPQNAKVTGSHTSLRISDSKGDRSDDDPVENLPSPTTQAAARLERWNAPRSHLYRSLAAFWSFVVMGSNDAAYGALIPYVRSSIMSIGMKRDTDNAIVARLLQPHFCRHLSRLSVSTSWVHGLGLAQQHHSPEVWATGCCHPRANVPFDCVYGDCGASSVPSAGGYLQYVSA